MQNNRKLKIIKTSVYSKLEPQQNQIVFFTYAEKEPWIKKISEYHKMPRNHLGYFQLNTTILVVIFQHFLIIQLTSESPQVKRYLISNITNLVQELPHELPNDLRLRKYQKNVKCGCRRSPIPSLPSRNQTLAIAVKKHAKLDIFLNSCPILLYLLTLCQIFCAGLKLTFFLCLHK